MKIRVLRAEAARAPRWAFVGHVAACHSTMTIDGQAVDLSDFGEIRYTGCPCSVAFVPDRGGKALACMRYGLTDDEYESLVEWFSECFSYCEACL